MFHWFSINMRQSTLNVSEIPELARTLGRNTACVPLSKCGQEILMKEEVYLEQSLRGICPRHNMNGVHYCLSAGSFVPPFLLIHRNASTWDAIGHEATAESAPFSRENPDLTSQCQPSCHSPGLGTECYTSDFRITSQTKKVASGNMP